MATAYAAIQPVVKLLVNDKAGKLVDFADYDTLIGQAIKGRYSQDRPLVKAKDYAGDGVTYQLTLPAASGSPAAYGWIEGFSTVASVEYPSGERPPLMLDPREISVDWISNTTKKLILAETTPATGQTARLLYTTQRVVEADVLLTDIDAVIKLSAAFCCRALAGLYAQTSDSTLGADVVNYRTKSQEYTSLADKFQKDYESQMGRDAEQSPAAAGGFVNWDTRLQTGYDHFAHPRRGR